MFETPILFIVFNRPEITKIVFDEIRKQKPKFLFIAADGPRKDNLQDIEKCKLTRDVVVQNIDWDCEVKTLFRDNNLGCGLAVSAAITWFFNNVDQGIILEDDCLPHRSFFGYCEVLLTKYKDYEQIFSISGNNFQGGKKRGDGSYFFSNYSHNWGWATWGRAWKHYDHQLTNLESFKANNKIDQIDSRLVFKRFWLNKFEEVRKGAYFHIWDYQWMFAIWNAGGLTVLPNVNLISNIGFGAEATHTFQKESIYSNMLTNDIGSIIHPTNIIVDQKADRYASTKVFNITTTFSKNKIKRKIKKIAKSFLAPELITFVRRKLKTHKHQFGVNLVKVPRYTETLIDFEGRPFIIPDSASFLFMYNEIFKEHIYNFNSLNEKPYIIDGGANIGLATIYLKMLYPSATIIAFEPDPIIYTMLKRNIEVFNFKDVLLFQKGIWNEDKILDFKLEGADAGIIAAVDKSCHGTEKIHVVSLKPFIDKPVDFLKIDIEGSETVVLRDIVNDLWKVKKIFIEYHSFINQPQSLNEIIDILTKANFRLHVSSPGLSTKAPFIELSTYNNMDMQLNIYGFKSETI